MTIDTGRVGQQGAGYASAAAMIAALSPAEPVFCLYGHRFAQTVQRFRAGFVGDLLYAVKANPDPHVLMHLHRAGIDRFDTASLAEIALVRRLLPHARCYYMAPVRPIGAAQEAYTRFQIRDFAIDTREEFDQLRQIAGQPADTTLYIRLMTPGTDALFELSSKFGASMDDAVALLQVAHRAQFKTALTFHVGSQCRDSKAFGDALKRAGETLTRANVPVCAIDIGGGFPVAYPGSDAAPLSEHLCMIEQGVRKLGLPGDVQLMAEPGRALCADGVSLVAQVILRHGQKLFLNDGIYGSFAELKLAQGAIALPSRCFHAQSNEREAALLRGPESRFTIYGPTCDSYDVFPTTVTLPDSIAKGDYIEFGLMGAYSVAMRTAFNGFFPDRFVEIGPSSDPPLT